MKVFSFVILLALIFNNVNAQYSLFIKEDRSKIKRLSETELKEQLAKYDFSTLFTYTDNTSVYGFIGNNYQRIRIKFISVVKDPSMRNTYKVYGKSMVKNNVDEFNGTIVITKISKQNFMSFGVDDEYNNKGLRGEFILSGYYILSENIKQDHSGIFEGLFRTGFYLDRKYLIHYDDIDNNSDGYMNNLFTGKWTDHKTHLSKICNWGDYRIPNSGNFDVGAGEFSPMTNDISLGWQNIHDMWVTDKNGKPTAKARLAKKSEESKWWQ